MGTSQGVPPVVTPPRTDGRADEILTGARQAACVSEMAVPHSRAMKTNTSTVVRWMSALLVTVSLVLSPELTRATEAQSIHRLWVARYDGPAHRNDIPSEVAVSPDGSTVFVTGDSYRPGCSNWATVAYDANGEELWSARYDGAEHWCDHAAGIAVSDDGARVFVTGEAQENDAGDIITVAYDAVDGSVLWVARENRPDLGADTAAGVATRGANVYVAGTVNTRCDESIDRCYYNVVVASYDGQTGHRRWIDEYESAVGTSSSLGAFASGITVGAGESVYVVAETAKGNVETLAYDGASGSRRWVVHSKEDYYVNAIETSPDGGIVYFAAFSANEKYSVTAYAGSDGSELWRVEKGSAIFGTPYIGVGPAGDEVLLAAESREDYLVIALDPDAGSVVWRARYDAEGRVSDSPAGVVVSADGEEVVVTGTAGRPRSWGSTYATVAFDGANGEKLWVKKYGFGRRLGNDHYATAIAASPQGSVYVSGESEGPTGWSDYATIRYG
jgi:DNA-binding beta-propeller fold protein YncE